MPTSVSKARDNRTSKLGSRSSEMRWQRENKIKLSWWNIERQLKAFLFIGYSYSCCTLFFFGLLYDKMTMTEIVVSKRALVFFWWEASLLFPKYRQRLSESDDHHNGLCIIYTLLFCLVRYLWLWGYLSFQIQEGHCYHSFFFTICLFVCLFVRSNQSGHQTSIC